ncbi:MAG: VOC family protein [Pseudomonadales bacterium]|jgi:hypothetical protein|nr:VOC family protein [Pseudomonadales bacterium]MDP6472385.1 VOC family protein [Pseudomonadales bacterium]MDP6828181.1 VOC family protein [Pseudomonadales bacterium]MDP6970259.1 VOC family protein [Pseudomonadales bacterium]|tara:strand:- start:378 stop:1082 length:705 start_codon:yes stop_codon:yes gene_type:complete
MHYPWHHVHITLPDRTEAAAWHSAHTPAHRVAATPRSENLYIGPNLLQIQGEAVATAPEHGRVARIGIGVPDVGDVVEHMLARGGRLRHADGDATVVEDAWGTCLELVERPSPGYTHVAVECHDPGALAAWYERMLGGIRGDCAWDRQRTLVVFDTMALTFEQRDTFKPETGIIDHYGWYTEDLDVAYSELSNLGVSFPVAPRQFGKVRLAFMHDPVGIWIELLEAEGKRIEKP